MLKIAVASGKGGTGKTTVATNLAFIAAENGDSVAYLDCDVEEPNGALFLKPHILESLLVFVNVPKVNSNMCNGCGKCGEICEYNAIVPMNNQVLLFPELCHGCAGCWMVCPTGAITKSKRVTGKLELGESRNIQFLQGLLNIGEAMSPPIIREVKSAAPFVDLQIVDSPPGTSCPVIESIRDADFVLLVTEPTPFGLNDLKLAVDTVRALNIPFGLVINRADVGDEQTLEYCNSQGIDILAEIPDDRRIAEAYSRGEMACEALSQFQQIFLNLLKNIKAFRKDS